MSVILRANFSKRYPGGPTIHVENLEVSATGVTVLFGPSGSGKTTILQTLAGLMSPDTGEIVFGEQQWFASDQSPVPPRLRRIGLVPQDYALFPHLTVAANISYGLHGATRCHREARVAEMTSWLELDGLESRLPAQLSGGQQQRVALARALAPRPQMLLLDEPLAALDAPTRQRVRTELRDILKRSAMPTILVTHDRLEALSLGDQLVVLHDGRIIQRGAVQEVFSRPTTSTVADIVAIETVQPGRILEIRDDLATVLIGNAKVMAVVIDLPSDTKDVFACIRAEDVILSQEPLHSSARNRFSAVVRNVWGEGALMRIELDCGFPLTAILTKQACAEMKLNPGTMVTALVKAPQIHLIPRSS